MIDKTSMMNTNISALARQAADTHTTGLANPTGATALRQRLLERQIPALSGWPAVPFPERMTDALRSVAEAQNESPASPGFRIGKGNRFGQSHGHTAGFFSWISDDPECPKQSIECL